MPLKKENQGCGCASVPISLIVVLLGVGYWGFTQLDKLNISKTIGQLLPHHQQPSPPSLPPVANSPLPSTTVTKKPTPQPHSSLPKHKSLPQTAWQKKAIRGIYLSRYQVTNNADEQRIRARVRYYRQQGMNTIIHGVWGNGCTMYNSQVMQQTFGFKSCPNQFKAQWLNWLIDEAHKQGMQVHAYFEKGIKIDKNSPIFDLAVSKGWLVAGVDKTYAGVDHYLLDVEKPEVASLFRNISVEFVQKYPKIDAVQWDDYLGYYADLPGKVDRTAHLTNFVKQMRLEIKNANPAVSFDLCHHNPYWGKRYFAADWQNWQVDRVFIQAYNNANFSQELNYAEKYAGIAITDQQLGRLQELMNNPKIKGVLVFPFSGQPEQTAARIKEFTPISSSNQQP